MPIKAPCETAHTSTAFKTAYCMPAAAVIREVHAGAVDAKVIFHISGEFILVVRERSSCSAL